MIKKQKIIIGLIVLVVGMLTSLGLGMGIANEKKECSTTSIAPFQEENKRIPQKVPVIPNCSKIIGKVLKYSIVNSTLEEIKPEQVIYILEVKLLSIEDIDKWVNLLRGKEGEIIKLYSKEKLSPELFNKTIEAKVEYCGDERRKSIWIWEIKIINKEGSNEFK